MPRTVEKKSTRPFGSQTLLSPASPTLRTFSHEGPGRRWDSRSLLPYFGQGPAKRWGLCSNRCVGSGSSFSVALPLGQASYEKLQSHSGSLLPCSHPT